MTDIVGCSPPEDHVDAPLGDHAEMLLGVLEEVFVRHPVGTSGHVLATDMAQTLRPRDLGVPSDGRPSSAAPPGPAAQLGAAIANLPIFVFDPLAHTHPRASELRASWVEGLAQRWTNWVRARGQRDALIEQIEKYLAVNDARWGTASIAAVLDLAEAPPHSHAYAERLLVAVESQASSWNRLDPAEVVQRLRAAFVEASRP